MAFIGRPGEKLAQAWREKLNPLAFSGDALTSFQKATVAKFELEGYQFVAKSNPVPLFGMPFVMMLSRKEFWPSAQYQSFEFALATSSDALEPSVPQCMVNETNLQLPANGNLPTNCYREFFT